MLHTLTEHIAPQQCMKYLSSKYLLGLCANVLPGRSAQGIVDSNLKARRGRKGQTRTAFELKGGSPAEEILRTAEKFHTQESGDIRDFSYSATPHI